jgi:Histidine kinase-, DNA gyrase B-, and HSP90-like ATPase
MPKYPSISYTHVLSELSVNRKDPCEIIRELISNAYDAKASLIQLYPLLQYEGIIFFDNGVGLSETEIINEITPYEAFFSIGRSTKIGGDFIGYKCQGSKLCFASRKFTLITRSRIESSWRTISIDNPKENLTAEYNIETQACAKPWELIRSLHAIPDERTKPILNVLTEEFFTQKFTSGAMMIIHTLEVENFPDFYATDGNNGSYLKNYIRFGTKHGDMRVLRPRQTGFPERYQKSFSKTSGYNDKCALYLWTKNQLQLVPVGYPYLDKLDTTAPVKSPSEVARLRDGQFSSRSADTFQYDGRVYCVTLAVDGNRRVLSGYPDLDRRGKKLTGMRLTDQRGVFICSQGVKICAYNELFDGQMLDDYLVLGKDDGQSHYILMINGNFGLVTNRNSLSEPAIKILKSESFIEKIKAFLDRTVKDDLVFRHLVERLRRETELYRLDTQLNQLTSLKSGIKDRTRFLVQDITCLEDKWLVAPLENEEHWVGALYTLFAHLVPTSSSCSNLWLRPRNFSGIGIDSIAVKLDEKDLSENSHFALEYKYTMSPDFEFNHPFIAVDQIVCWDMIIPEEGTQITDSYDHFGEVQHDLEFAGVGYVITNIQSRTGQFDSGKIPVISLKNLISRTFNVKWTTPPPPSNGNGKSRSIKRQT